MGFARYTNKELWVEVRLTNHRELLRSDFLPQQR